MLYQNDRVDEENHFYISLGRPKSTHKKLLAIRTIFRPRVRVRVWEYGSKKKKGGPARSKKKKSARARSEKKKQGDP